MDDLVKDPECRKMTKELLVKRGVQEKDLERATDLILKRMDKYFQDYPMRKTLKEWALSAGLSSVEADRFVTDAMKEIRKLEKKITPKKGGRDAQKS